MSRRLLGVPATAVLMLLSGGAHGIAAAQDVDACTADARSRATDAIANGAAPYETRRRLEIDVILCENPGSPEAAAAFAGTINADLADFAHQFLLGRIDQPTYRNARLDRSRKLRELGEDASLHAALADGDEDGDLIPDDRDGCPATPRGTPTDDWGCPAPAEEWQPDHDQYDLSGRIRELTLLKNDSCDGAPEPLASKPFRWGRSSTNAPIPLGSFKLVVAQVNAMPDGCEVFYEFRLHWLDPSNSKAPPTADVSVVFSEREDLDPDPGVATFGFPADQPPASPGRAAAIDAFQIYRQVRWRVRTAIGGPVTSPWSASITQKPASGGIP